MNNKITHYRGERISDMGPGSIHCMLQFLFQRIKRQDLEIKQLREENIHLKFKPKPNSMRSFVDAILGKS